MDIGEALKLFWAPSVVLGGWIVSVERRLSSLGSLDKKVDKMDEKIDKLVEHLLDD